MQAPVLERDETMGKKKARSTEPVRRNDVPARIDANVLEDVRLIATLRKISIAEYLSEVVGPIVKRDIEEALAKRAQSGPIEPKKRPDR